MELHRPRASQVSAAQPLKEIYHQRLRLSNGILVVKVVYMRYKSILIIFPFPTLIHGVLVFT